MLITIRDRQSICNSKYSLFIRTYYSVQTLKLTIWQFTKIHNNIAITILLKLSRLGLQCTSNTCKMSRLTIATARTRTHLLPEPGPATTAPTTQQLNQPERNGPPVESVLLFWAEIQSSREPVSHSASQDPARRKQRQRQQVPGTEQSMYCTLTHVVTQDAAVQCNQQSRRDDTITSRAAHQNSNLRLSNQSGPVWSRSHQGRQKSRACVTANWILVATRQRIIAAINTLRNLELTV